MRAIALSIASVMFFPVLVDVARAGEAAHPIKLAVFDFEMEDFSGGAGLVGQSADDTKQLDIATQDARRAIAQSGRYVLVDVGAAQDEAVEKHTLRRCDGCDAAIAARVGADQSLVGVVTRISRTDFVVTYSIRDAHSGAPVLLVTTGLRLGSSSSWNRGAIWLVENRILSK